MYGGRGFEEPDQMVPPKWHEIRSLCVDFDWNFLYYIDSSKSTLLFTSTVCFGWRTRSLHGLQAKISLGLFGELHISLVGVWFLRSDAGTFRSQSNHW